MNNPYGTIEQEQGSLIRQTSSRSKEADMDHLGAHRSYWRDIILGVNDGLISTFLLIAGVSGSGLRTTDILLTAIAGALAGAVSMSAGEFVATKSQNQVLHGEINLERAHIKENMESELREVYKLLEIIGIPSSKGSLQEQLIRHYESDPEALLKIMVALEFGVVETEERSPWAAAGVSGGLFFLGSLPSLVPFIPKDQTPQTGLFIATIATIISLLFVGAVKTWATRGECVTAAVENLFTAGAGGVLAFVVGAFFDKMLHKDAQ